MARARNPREAYLRQLKRVMRSETASATERTEARKSYERLMFGGGAETVEPQASVPIGEPVVPDRTTPPGPVGFAEQFHLDEHEALRAINLTQNNQRWSSEYQPFIFPMSGDRPITVAELTASEHFAALDDKQKSLAIVYVETEPDITKFLRQHLDWI